jgi:Na+:H+ antiporter, NhaA family
VSGLYGLAFRYRLDRAWVLWTLAVAAWICIHASGVHPTVAGIILGLLTPVRPRSGEEDSPSEHLEHRLHHLSAGVAVPIFALAATGIPLAAAGDAFGDAIAIGVFDGLLIGKVAGIFGGAQVAVRLRLGALPEDVRWGDVVPVAVLGAIGYTVPPDRAAGIQRRRGTGALSRRRARRLGVGVRHRRLPAPPPLTRQLIIVDLIPNATRS